MCSGIISGSTSLLSRTSRADRDVGRFLWVSSSTVSSLEPEGGDQEIFLTIAAFRCLCSLSQGNPGWKVPDVINYKGLPSEELIVGFFTW